MMEAVRQTMGEIFPIPGFELSSPTAVLLHPPSVFSHFYNMQSTTKTNEQYDQVINSCREVFLNKARDYGSSWRVLRIISIADQIFIKAQRIRTIQEKRMQKVGDDIADEFRGIVNYGIIGLIQLSVPANSPEEMALPDIESAYLLHVKETRDLMLAKNHDYGEAWREMSQESFTDLILTKIRRIRQILANDGQTIISEGIDANFADIINYAVFALILIGEGKHQGS